MRNMRSSRSGVISSRRCTTVDDACIVDETVEPAEMLVDGGKDGPDIVGRADIAGDRDRLAAGIADRSDDRSAATLLEA